MLIYLKIIRESFTQAIEQLTGNKLRSFLSLLGITIGIFCIISVMSAVDSLESNIRSSFDKLGNDVVYIEKRPWNENPHENYWKYAARPNPDEEDLEVIRKRSKTVDQSALAVFMPGRTVKYRSSNVRGAYISGITYEYNQLIQLDIQQGRYFTTFEQQNGSNRAILGHSVASELFGEIDPVGKEIKLWGRNFSVIGVLEPEGESIISVIPFDRAIFIGYNSAKKLINVGSKSAWGSMLMAKAGKDVEISSMVDELTGILRAHRRIKPVEKPNFAINQVGLLSSIIDSIFGVMNLAGWAIGIFAIFVGIFSVANIMFVSVKERTNIIGIKKALGAKRYFILLEFLNEAVVLCLIGGVAGLGLVYLTVLGISQAIDFSIFLSTTNIIFGVGLSAVIGVLSGLIPALKAAGMDPVVAIQSK